GAEGIPRRHTTSMAPVTRRVVRVSRGWERFSFCPLTTESMPSRPATITPRPGHPAAGDLVRTVLKISVVSVAGVGQSEAKETPVECEELREPRMNSVPL
ncbi:MAG TPA: hypothetical protein VNQ76_22250, partial [Planctomicrobium sp.]|nr:hypothetical protein [Planctomicrobium sp.]